MSPEGSRLDLCSLMPLPEVSLAPGFSSSLRAQHPLLDPTGMIIGATYWSISLGQALL